jgi:hypothetical protein
LFEIIKSLRPYFFSLREIDNNVSLDLKLPLTWRYEEVSKPYSSIKIKVQDKNEKNNLISFIAQSTQNGYDVVFACATEVVNSNKEEEEKQKLFQSKVKELQELFKKESLEKLKDINLLNSYGQENSTSIGLVEKGDAEGFEGDGGTQEDDDQ